jgi:simple sugar transport system ATP-binding protein
MNSATEAIRAEKLVKAFGSVTALAGVSLTVAWGETLGILGDNGAGKSTLIKILTGYHQPDSGQVFVERKPVQLASVDDARALGIECVYQDLALVNGLSIYHNMFLNRERCAGGRCGYWTIARCGGARPRHWRQSASTCRRSSSRSARSRVGSARRSPWRVRSIQRRASCCSTSRSRRWGRARGAADHRADRTAAGARRHRHRDDRTQLQTLELCDRVVLMQHGEITFESQAAATSAEELLEIVRPNIARSAPGEFAAAPRYLYGRSPVRRETDRNPMRDSPAVEIEPGLPLDRGGCGQIEDSPRASLGNISVGPYLDYRRPAGSVYR